jgi:hypothetical protein
MKWSAKVYLPLLLVLSGALSFLVFGQRSKEILRPEEVRSKRVVIFDEDTYHKLDSLWQRYYDAFPSEYAYANWMYAARYAGNRQYSKWLEKGLKKYPSNPVLLYLTAMQSKDSPDPRKSREILEKAIAIDPQFVDPWFSLVTIYMHQNDDARVDDALKRILESGYITDDVMDYNYNVLIGLDSNSVLLTNGDNDTYPAWILTRVLNVRSDIAIVNRSLLNTDWYPVYLVNHGTPRFIAADQIEQLRKAVFAELETKKKPIPPEGPFSDTLTVRLINAAQAEGRPVYFGQTLYENDLIKRYREHGRVLGLAVLVSPAQHTYSEQLHRLYATWIRDYRTGGLDGWRLHSAKSTDAGRFLVFNYATAPLVSMDSLIAADPKLIPALREWYHQHIELLLPADMRTRVNQEWDSRPLLRSPAK